ncbi:hypothetical protein ACFX13_003509 [Malus domestica]
MQLNRLRRGKIDNGFQRGGGAIFVLLNHIVLLYDFYFSVEEGRGRSPDNPPSILTTTHFLSLQLQSSENPRGKLKLMD